MKLKIYFFVFFIALLLNSCNKDQNIEPSYDSIETNKAFTIKNDMLFFKSSLVFYKTIEKLDSMNNTEIEQWLVENKFHNSLYFKMKELEECGDNIDDGFSLAPGDIKDKSFATLLNSNGLISIGDTISYLTKYNEYVITDGDISKVQRIKDNPDAKYTNVEVLLHNPPTLKGTITYTLYRNYPYKNDIPPLYIRIDRRISIYFWTHSSYVKVELVHEDGSSREIMHECTVNASGEFCSNDKYDNCFYQSASASQTTNERKSNEVRIYRNTGRYGFCSKNITVNGTVRRQGNNINDNGNAYPEVGFSVSFDSDICYDIE